MPQFHETMYGRKFFTSQLPNLIKSLNGIEAQLKRQNELAEDMINTMKASSQCPAAEDGVDEIDFDDNEDCEVEQDDDYYKCEEFDNSLEY